MKFVKLKADADSRKQSCDANFYVAIVNGNPTKPVCRTFATIYKGAVQYFGGGAFAGIDGKVVGGQSPAQEERSKKAISDLLTQLSDQQLTEYSLAIEAGKVRLDWKKEIAFSKDRLLYNP